MEEFTFVEKMLSKYVPEKFLEYVLLTIFIIIIYKVAKPFIKVFWIHVKIIYGRLINLLDISDEFKNNHGSSLRDIIDSIHRTVKSTNLDVKTLAEKTRVLIQIFGEMPYSPGIYETDADGKCLFVSKKWTEMTGIDEIHSLGHGWIAGIYEEDREKVFNLWKLAIETGSRFDMEYRMVNINNGNITKVIGHCYPILDNTNKVVRFIGAVYEAANQNA